MKQICCHRPSRSCFQFLPTYSIAYTDTHMYSHDQSSPFVTQIPFCYQPAFQTIALGILYVRLFTLFQCNYRIACLYLRLQIYEQTCMASFAFSGQQKRYSNTLKPPGNRY